MWAPDGKERSEPGLVLYHLDMPGRGGVFAAALGLLLAAAGGSAQELDQKLQAAWKAKGPAYQPRTRHLNPDGSPQFTNRLIFESSPYLLQHAHNPVNWYAWGEEAFTTARKLNRPVLLSVGYSTCHWCHVMEEESFEDLEIARYLNENYIAIKVDREERPDIDSLYMTAVQALTGRGGWPMTVWLTPARKPFYAGTYFPPRDGDRGVSLGFLSVLTRLRQIYHTEPERVAESADHVTEKIQEFLTPAAGTGLPRAAVLHEAARHAKDHFDPVHGGMKGAPKFPSGLPHRFLLRYHRRTGDPLALRAAVHTLEKMAQGGMYDHAGGGFHRYATDERWLVPHFEKMLYDNALLALDYLEAHQATGREDFAALVRDILRYVARDMTSPEGAFYSATDADSPAPSGKPEEGWFFTWTPSEVTAVLGPERAKFVNAYYRVTPQGNFEGRTILHTPRPLEEAARELGLPAGKASALLEESRELLYRARLRRPPPLRDEKILTAWNGLMISAYARAALVLNEPDYARRAERAAQFVLRHLRREGRLLRSYHEGRPRHNAYLEDYSFLAAGLLDLYETTSDKRWLEEALGLDGVLEKFYEDREQGGFFHTSNDHELLLAREKPASDGAEPSGNSVAILNLLRLHEFTTQDRYRVRAERALRAFEPRLAAAPASLAEMLLAVDFHLDTPKEVVIVAPSERSEAEPLLDRLRQTFLPNRVLIVVSQGPDLASHAKLVPLLDGKRALQGRPTAYVCEKRVCELPASDPEVFARQLRKLQPLEKAAAP
jgi:uncharacterized protein YyaL (SSP411 family)